MQKLRDFKHGFSRSFRSTNAVCSKEGWDIQRKIRSHIQSEPTGSRKTLTRQRQKRNKSMMAQRCTIATASHAEISGSRARRNWRSGIPGRRIARQRTCTLWNSACTSRSNVSGKHGERERQRARGCCQFTS